MVVSILLHHLGLSLEFMTSLGHISVSSVRPYLQRKAKRLVLSIILQLLVRNLKFVSGIQMNCSSLRTGLFKVIFFHLRQV